MVRDWKVVLIITYRAQMLCEWLTESVLGLTDVEEATSGAADTVQVGECAGESLSALESLSGALDSDDGDGVGAGVAPPVVAGKGAEDSGVGGECGVDNGVVETLEVLKEKLFRVRTSSVKRMSVSVEGDGLDLQERRKQRAFRPICMADTGVQGLDVHYEDVGARELKVVKEVEDMDGVPNIGGEFLDWGEKTASSPCCSEPSPADWWETVKENIMRIFIPKDVQKARLRWGKLFKLQKSLQTMGFDVKEDLQEVKSQQVSLFALEASKIIFQSRICSMEQDEMSSHIFFQKVHMESSVLSHLKEEDGSISLFQSDVLRISKHFYARLYDMKPTDSTASQLFLSSIVEILDENTWDRLDHPLPLDELTETLVSFEKDKTPRSDGFLGELYSAQRDLIGQDLQKVNDNMLLEEPFAESIKKVVSLRGVTLPGSRCLQFKASLYVDDITVFCWDLLLVSRLMSICDRFELASGAKVNRGSGQHVASLRPCGERRGWILLGCSLNRPSKSFGRMAHHQNFPTSTKCKELTSTKCCRLAHSKVQDYVLRDTLKIEAAVAKAHRGKTTVCTLEKKEYEVNQVLENAISRVLKVNTWVQQAVKKANVTLVFIVKGFKYRSRDILLQFYRKL
eukprot:g48321.t1